MYGGPVTASRWGLTLPLPGTPLSDHRPFVEQAEAEGYTDLWTGETGGPDGFTPLALSAAWTSNIRLGTGIVGVFQRGPALLAQQAAAMTDASSGRFVLGIGASSDRMVAGWNEIPFEKPLSKVEKTVDFLRVALAGERTTTGFKLETAPTRPTPIVLAALRGKMLRLAVDKADGAFTNFLPIGGLPKVVEGISGSAPDFELLCRFFCIPGERDQVEPLARFMFSSYVTVPVYASFFRWLGYEAEIANMVKAWEEKDRAKAAAEAPWDLIESTFLLGSPEQIRDRLDEYVAGGITLPVITPITTPEKMGPLISSLAP
jgi:probable F420-dependent oxidoreductase